MSSKIWNVWYTGRCSQQKMADDIFNHTQEAEEKQNTVVLSVDLSGASLPFKMPMFSQLDLAHPLDS